ncbi:MAG: porin [Nitrospirota bacterium]|nr:porin [Nitrospirota bacterium]
MGKNKRKFSFVLSAVLLSQLALFSIFSSKAHAGGKIDIGDNRSISLGVGLRSSFTTAENGAPNGSSNSKDFNLDSVRLYVGGQFSEMISFEFNSDYDNSPTGTEEIRVLDAVIKFAFTETFNIWAGRFLPPSDRSNLSGPYYLNAWDFPFIQLYPNVFAGRDDGLAIWGQVDGGKFKYQIGAFEGQGDTPGGPNQSDALLYAGRLTLNLLDPEPGYYNSSTYYGGKDVLAIGLVGQYQEDATGTAGAAGSFKGWNLDLLFEKDLSGAGVATLEGAYYNYDTENTAGTLEGEGFMGLASFLFPNKLGSGSYAGQLQPMVRYQEFEFKRSVGERTQTDIGLSHIMDGHNARLTVTYSIVDNLGIPDVDTVKFGIQFQI